LPESFCFSGNGTIFCGDGQIICGENSYIGHNGYIKVAKGTIVKIGTKCRLGDNLTIHTVETKSDQDYSKEDLESNLGNVIIGDYCWIGTHVFMREGTSIGCNAVVGAYCVVTHSFPSWVVIAGNPARIIRRKVQR
jgi:maltose O-acetyltransferase